MTTRQKDRIPIPAPVRREVLERDNHSCQKCGWRKRLHAHHILPSAEGGLPIAENLITLCSYCHSEWENNIYIRTRSINFRDWLEIPAAVHLTKIFVNPSFWTEDMTAKQMREFMIHSYTSIKDINMSEEEEESEEFWLQARALLERIGTQPVTYSIRSLWEMREAS